MAMLDLSKLSYAFKKLAGKINSDNSKEVGNEALSSGFSVSGTTVFGEALPSSPDNSTLYTISGSTVEYVRLVLDVDPSANGHNFIAKLPSDYETTSSNPKKGTYPFLNGQVLASTSGALQLCPSLYGLNYEPKPYRGGTGVKGSGSLVPPGDQIDWICDPFAGTIFQENSPDTSPANLTYVECFIYVGKMITEVVSSGQEDISGIITKAANSGLTQDVQGVVDALDLTAYTTVKWLISARNGNNVLSTEMLASSRNSISTYNSYAELSLGTTPAGFCNFDVDVSGSNMRLLATSNQVGTSVNVVRINII